MTRPKMEGEAAEVVVDAEEAAELEPIYSALADRGAPRRRGNIGCSGSKKSEFCYLCNYVDTPDASGTLLKDHILTLVDQGKELHFIAKAVQAIYDNELREFSVWEKEGGKTIVEKPEWKTSSIVRHLLMSSEFEVIFEAYQSQVFKSMIVRQAERVVDMDSGSVDEGAAKALMTTMRNFDEHKSRMRLLGNKRRRIDTKQDLG